MTGWRDFWNGEHSIYVSQRHKWLHYDRVAKDLAGLIVGRDSVVLDHGCGECILRLPALASIVAALSLPVFVWLDRGTTPVFWVSLTVAAFILWSHRVNIKRLRAGTESHLRRKKTEESAGKENAI